MPPPSSTHTPSTGLSSSTTEDLRTAVSAVLHDFVRDQAAVLREVSEDCDPVLAAISDLLAGGKRLRPAFCYWGFHGVAREISSEVSSEVSPDQPDEGIVTAAASLELFQAAALIHDDVMDDSDTRRGKPAVHRRFEALHREQGWDGSGERFGLAGAVLAGDLCLSWSDELFSRSGLDAAAVTRGRRVFNIMRTQLMGGQYLDMLEQASSAQRGVDGAVDRARRVLTFKSAKYSIEHPLLLGGSLAGASTDLLADYSRFGLALGEAFQLRDDVLGVYGDPTETGKPAGDDLREGKRTVLVGLAVQNATEAQAEQVDRLLGSADLDAEGIATLRQVLVDTGALDGVERLIAEQVEVACATLEEADITAPARAALHELVVAATSRRS